MPGTWNIHELKWLFQLDASKSLYEKWLEITKHPLNNGCLEFQVSHEKKNLLLSIILLV